MLTRETLNRLHELTEKNAEAKEHSSDLLKAAQDRAGHRTHKVPRTEGPPVELTEKTMWDEVFYLGTGCESGKELKRLHPEVFQAYAEQDAVATELKKFAALELGLDFTALTLSDYLRMTEALFDLMLEERKVAVMRDVPAGDNVVQTVPVAYEAPEGPERL